MKIITLGPKGTFSEQAALKYQEEIGGGGEIIFGKNIREIFDLVNKGEIKIGIVPVENMIDGSVGETLDLLDHYKLNIISEMVIPIKMCIAGLGDISEIKKVFSKDKALGQCIDFIREKGFETEESLSTAEAMKIVSESKDNSLGAIGTELAAKEYGLKILEKSIEDRKGNLTRFFVISKDKRDKQEDKKYKTSIAIHIGKDKAGVLHSLLNSFATRKIGLSKIESRPTKKDLGAYIFYVDLIGHEQDEDIQEAIKEIGATNILKVFGSYEKKY